VNSWMRIGFDSWMLGVESASVIGLRTLRLAGGGAAGADEAELMVREKLEAAGAWQIQAMTGGLGANPTSAARKSIAHYRRKVRANQRRLSRQTQFHLK